MSRRGKKTKNLCVTVGEREMEMLREIAERHGFVSLSEAVRAVIRRHYETVTQRCDRCHAEGREPERRADV
jgi:hypothetical protein